MDTHVSTIGSAVIGSFSSSNLDSYESTYVRANDFSNECPHMDADIAAYGSAYSRALFSTIIIPNNCAYKSTN
jgi:hypothetical protein